MPGFPGSGAKQTELFKALFCPFKWPQKGVRPSQMVLVTFISREAEKC